MKCPYCDCEEVLTIDTRDAPGNAKRRRRQCANCKKRFTTYEHIASKKSDLKIVLVKVKERKKYDREHISKSVRYKVMRRDEFRCVLCGRSPATTRDLTLHIDHIVPVVRGGKNKMSNLRTLCADCNLGKNDKIEDMTTISSGLEQMS